MDIVLSKFAGWGPCGALNSPGETEFYFLATIFQLIGLGVSSLILLLANSRIVKRLDQIWLFKRAYLFLNMIAAAVRFLVIYSALVVIADYTFGDANLSDRTDEGTPCDPVTQSMIFQVLIVTTIASIMLFGQFKKYDIKRNARVR